MNMKTPQKMPAAKAPAAKPERQPIAANESREIRRLSTGGMTPAQIGGAVGRRADEVAAELSRNTQWAS